MTYFTPKYILTAVGDNPIIKLEFEWFDWKASELFEYDPSELLERLSVATPRAKIATAIGMYEWILWALKTDNIKLDQISYDLVEAGWCANISPSYMEYFEISRKEWVGQIRGPLWCATTWLVPMFFYKEEGEEELESGISYLSALAFHVVPNKDIFQKWLDQLIDRLILSYTDSPQDIFYDLFEEEDKGGDLVSKEVLDPFFTYQPNDVSKLIQQYLNDVDYKNNELLNSPETMLEKGFKGTPYIL